MRWRRFRAGDSTSLARRRRSPVGTQSVRQCAMLYMCSENVHGLGDGSRDRPCIRGFCGTRGTYASTIACGAEPKTTSAVELGRKADRSDNVGIATRRRLDARNYGRQKHGCSWNRLPA